MSALPIHGVAIGRRCKSSAPVAGLGTHIQELPAGPVLFNDATAALIGTIDNPDSGERICLNLARAGEGPFMGIGLVWPMTTEDARQAAATLNAEADRLETAAGSAAAALLGRAGFAPTDDAPQTLTADTFPWTAEDPRWRVVPGAMLAGGALFFVGTIIARLLT